MRSKSFAGLNTLNLESRLLTRSEINTIDGRDLLARVKNIVFQARRKVASPEHGAAVASRLFMIMNKGVEAMGSANLETLKSFYRDTYLPLVQQDMTYDVSGGPVDFSVAADSEWADYFTTSLDAFDSKITELKYGGDEVLSASYPMSGFGSADTGWEGEESSSAVTTATSESDNSTMIKTLQWGSAIVAGYFVLRHFTKKSGKSKR